MEHRLFECVVCPVCYGKLQWNKEHDELICPIDRLAYPIRDGIPVLLEDEARKLSMDDEI